jgi:hypothetical protein
MELRKKERKKERKKGKKKTIGDLSTNQICLLSSIKYSRCNNNNNNNNNKG